MQRDMIQLTQTGDVFVIEHNANGKLYASDALYFGEVAVHDIADFNCEESVNAEAYALGILSTDLESDEPQGDAYRIIESVDTSNA